MIRLFYNEDGDIEYSVTLEAAVDRGMPYIDYHDDNIRINEWKVDTTTLKLVPNDNIVEIQRR